MKNLLFLALLSGTFWTSCAAAANPNRPNFLFIYTDDQRYDAMGVVQREQGVRGRFPWFKTPNMDRMAAEGVRFRNAFASSSLCSPSRASFLTGRYNHLNGVANNHTPFPTNSVTHATVLRAAGYKTGYIGKWHMGNQRGQRPGFDFSASYLAHGRYGDCPFEINGVSEPTKGWVDDVTTDFAIKFMRTNHSEPFLLVVGFKSPHDPRTPPDRLKNAFAGEVFRPAVNRNARPPYLTGGGKPSAEQPDPSTTERQRDYFRCIAGADENLGRLLDTLDELGIAENTMVIYTSDNGYYLGDHGLGDKRSAYEESIRIPLLLRFPKLGVKGLSVDESILNVDLAPTLIDYAGLPIPTTMQGRSWRPLLERKATPTTPWRRSFFYEYFYERNFAVPTLFAVRTDTAKLIKYKDHEDWTELFDLTKDPFEMKNLSRESSAAGLREKLDAEYEHQKQAVDFVWPAYATDELALPSKTNLDAWVLDYRFDKDEGDRVVDVSGKANDGHAHGVALVDGRDGKKARRFTGAGCIEVPRTPALNPALRGWTIELTYKAQAPDGVLLAHGGANFGYCLALEGGQPAFTVVGQRNATRVLAPDNGDTAWTTVRASITSDGVLLSVNGKPPSREPLRTPILKEPVEALQIGDDLGTAVLSAKKPPAFKGLIESVRIYSGDANQSGPR
jgi:arylsulfatase A-like enzyme